MLSLGLFFFRLLVLLFPVLAIQDQVLPHRMKRQDNLVRRLESLTIRVEILEIDLRKEKEINRDLQAKISDVKRANTVDNGGRIGQDVILDEDKIVTEAVSQTTTILRGDLKTLRQSLYAQKLLQKHMKESMAECKSEIHEKLTFEKSFGSSLVEIRENITALSESIRELKKNQSLWQGRPPGPGKSNPPDKKVVSCPRCITTKNRFTGLSVSEVTRLSCDNNIAHIYIVKVTRTSSQPIADRIEVPVVVESYLKKDGAASRISQIPATVWMSKECECQKMEAGQRFMIMMDRQAFTTPTGGIKGPELHLKSGTLYTKYPGKRSLVERRHRANIDHFLRRFRKLTC